MYNCRLTHSSNIDYSRRLNYSMFEQRLFSDGPCLFLTNCRSLAYSMNFSSVDLCINVVVYGMYRIPVPVIVYNKYT